MRLGFTYPQLLSRRDEAIDRRFTHWSFYKTPIFGGNSMRGRQLFFFGSRACLLCGVRGDRRQGGRVAAARCAILRLDALGIRGRPRASRPAGDRRGPAWRHTSNYFRGNDRSHSMTGIANYRQSEIPPSLPRHRHSLLRQPAAAAFARRAPSATFSAARRLRLGRDSLRRLCRQTR